MAILTGCNVRTGLEDNVFYHKGKLATSNAQLVERVVRLAKELGRDIATPDEARTLLRIGGAS
jgi:3-keto-5-aminohexanoate cleavage enzyme